MAMSRDNRLRSHNVPTHTENFMDADGRVYEVRHFSDGSTKRVRVDDDYGWSGYEQETDRFARRRDKEYREIHNRLKKDVISLADIKLRIDTCFQLMNWYASGDHMTQWSRVDPQSILAEVYAYLAPVSNALQELEDPDSGFAEAQYAKALTKAEAQFDHDVNRIKAEHQSRYDNAKHNFENQIEAMKAGCLKEVNEARAGIEAEVQKRVAAELKRLDDIRNGSLRNANGRAIRL